MMFYVLNKKAQQEIRDIRAKEAEEAYCVSNLRKKYMEEVQSLKDWSQYKRYLPEMVGEKERKQQNIVIAYLDWYYASLTHGYTWKKRIECENKYDNP